MQAAVLEVITDGVRKGGVIEIGGNVKQAGNVIGTLSHSSSSKKGAGSTRTKKTVLFSPKNGQLEVATKPAGISPLSHWDIYLYIGSGYIRRDGTDMLLMEPRALASFEAKKLLAASTMPILPYCRKPKLIIICSFHFTAPEYRNQFL